MSGGAGGTVVWSLTGSDAGAFRIPNGVVSFRSAPDYESKNSYTFTVRATVDGESLTRSVTVNVTNVDEDGTVTISPSRLIEVDTVLTATLTDPDGGLQNMSLGVGQRVCGHTWGQLQDLHSGGGRRRGLPGG